MCALFQPRREEMHPWGYAALEGKNPGEAKQDWSDAQRAEEEEASDEHPRCQVLSLCDVILCSDEPRERQVLLSSLTFTEEAAEAQRG